MSQQHHPTRETAKNAPTKQPTTHETAAPAALPPLSVAVQRAVADPRSLTPHEATALHKALGARAAQQVMAGRNDGRSQLLRPAAVQTKLTVGPAGDRYEQEADRVAQQVIGRLQTPPPSAHTGDAVQRDEELEAGDLQTPAPTPAITPLVQRAIGAAGGAVDSDLENSIRAATSGGAPLPEALQHAMGAAFGHADFSNVRVHADSTADTLNRSLSARAFTRGRDIFFRQNEYNPDSAAGQQLIAHELTHTVQQGAVEVQRHPQHEGMTQESDDDAVQRRTAQSGHGHGCSCPACMGVQRKPAAAIQRHGDHGLFEARQEIQRSVGQHGRQCGCAACSANSRPPSQSMHSGAFRFKQPALTGQPDAIQRHIAAKNLWLAQRKTMATPAPQVHHTPEAHIIQRHSSWEHQLLGDVPPDQLAKLGAWQDLMKQTELTGYFGFRKPKQEEASVNIQGVGVIKKGNIMHVIAQEMQRLSVWQQKPPQGTSAKDKEELYGKDPVWQVELVALPAPEGQKPLIITYGEMNTLADFYGDLETMKQADPENRRQIVQSVRQETFLRLRDIYTQLQESLTEKEKKDADVLGAQKMMSENVLHNQKLGFKFAGAMTPDYVSGKAGQLDLLSGAQSTGAQGVTNAYGATLARNACHFVPESWHSWARYHNQARDHARSAYQRRQQARQIEQEIADEATGLDDPAMLQELMERFDKEADDAANEALLNNGFGDHYLQDSYASGHMLNKTQIMQWYVEYLDTADDWRYFTDQNWRKVQAMAYRQPGLAAKIMYNKQQVRGGSDDQEPLQARNPQAVEDIQDEDWKTRFDALGLQVPESLRTPGSPERQLMEWWQGKAVNPELAILPGNLLQRASPLRQRGLLEPALKNLVHDGIVYVEGESLSKRGEWMSDKRKINFGQQFAGMRFALRNEYIPRDIERFKKAKQESAAGDDTQYQRMAASVTYGDYFEFMNSSLIQKATNALHDTFCTGGLNVLSGDGRQIFKVYGDDAMLNAGSAAGVKDSAETANMSRDAILNIVRTGGDGGKTAESILGRLPDTVRVDVKDDGGKVVGTADTKIENWHNPDRGPSLKQLCMKEVFPSMSWSLLQKLGPGAVGTLGQISRDMNVHGGEAF